MAEPMSPEERALLAGELSLGLLSGEDRLVTERLRAEDSVFAAEVDAWDARFAGFYGEIVPVTPEGRVWSAVEQRLPANDPGPAGGAGGWKWATAGFAGIAAALAVMLVTRPDPVAPPPVVVAEAPAPVPSETLIAQINDGDGASMLAVRIDPGDGVLRVRAMAIPPSAGEPELWVIPAGGAPTSLGLIAREGGSEVRLAGDVGRLITDGATLALTLEPADGAPHAAPTGDVLGTARLTRL
ncbi:anti-sigma factor [Sphingomonas sp. 37zxx]|uniref:anti-sigma factor n=1 Tax=Sphingomonas sp. 37zxx TaxID=1550073 RepID=UPI00053BF9BF|nr:anti-sigma factor [Sphingomonas sp. 37zxx]